MLHCREILQLHILQHHSNINVLIDNYIAVYLGHSAHFIWHFVGLFGSKMPAWLFVVKKDVVTNPDKREK